MWLEAVFSRDDLASLVQQALPLTIHLGDDAQHSVAFSDMTEVRFVADRGVAITCSARIHWAMLGIEVPITVSPLSVLLLPTVAKGPDGDVLVFRLRIEHANVAVLPTMIDERITEGINAKLAESESALTWNFRDDLTYSENLPAMLDPLDVFAARPAWAKLRITDEAMVVAVSFHSAIVRRGEAIPPELAPSTHANGAPASEATQASPPTRQSSDEGASPAAPVSSSRRSAMSREPSVASPLMKACLFGLATGTAFFAFRALRSRP